MDKTPLGPARIAVIAGFALSCFGLLLYLWLTFGGPAPLKPEGYRFKVAVADAPTLAAQADVRIAGVSVGKVVDEERIPNRTLATIELKPEFAPIKADTRAILRQKTLLGESYLELTPAGRDGEDLADGGRLADAQVEPTVEFDELLRTFDADTRKAFRDWQASLAKATAGKGEEVSDALGQLPNFVSNAGDVVSTLERRREALAGLVRGTGSTFAALTRNEAALQGLATNGATAMGALSQRREQLAETFQVLPTFLRESRATLDRLRTFSADTNGLVRDLEPVLRDVQPTVRALRTLSPDLERLFTDLSPLVDAGRAGLPALSRVLRGLDPTLAETGTFLRQLNPILQYLELQQATVSNFLNIGPSALNLKLTPPANGDSNGHALPQLIVLGSQTLPARSRTPDNRGNAYLAPDALVANSLKDPNRFALPSYDCANSGGEKPPTDTPGCAVQAPFSDEDGQLTRYPQVGQAGPGGVINRRTGR